MEINSEQSRIVDGIKEFDADIEKTKQKVNTIKEQIEELLDSLNEYHDMIEVRDELALKREKLRLKLLQNSQYNNLLERLADEREFLKSTKQNLSDYIVAYFSQTGERQVDLGSDARDLIMQGKLGKHGKKYQTNIFAE